MIHIINNKYPYEYLCGHSRGNPSNDNEHCPICAMLDTAELKSTVRNILTSHNPQLPEFLLWLANRLVIVYKESPNVDFVTALEHYAHKLDILRNQLK